MKEIELGAICEFINGGAWSDKEYVSSGIPVLKVSNFKPNGFLIDDINYLPLSDTQKYAKNKLLLNDVIIATVGSHPNLQDSAAGRSCVVNSLVEGFYLNQNAVCIRTTDSEILDQRYLGYLAKSREFQHYIQSRGRGAANQMRIAISSIKEYKFYLPKIEIQRRIADILSTYDDLIENNRKQIKLLEEAAQRLYKEWFVDLRFPGHEHTKIVDGVPEGWEKRTVGSLIDKPIRTKQIPTADYQTDGMIPVIDQSREFISGYTNDTESLVQSNVPVIVFGDHTRILKLIQFPFAKGADGTQLICSSSNHMPQRLLYCSLLNIDLSNYHYARHFKYLKAEVIFVPTVEIANLFESIAEPLYTKVQRCREICYQAQQARDRLLPKLMTGEVEV